MIGWSWSVILWEEQKTEQITQDVKRYDGAVQVELIISSHLCGGFEYCWKEDRKKVFDGQMWGTVVLHT